MIPHMPHDRESSYPAGQSPVKMCFEVSVGYGLR